MFKNKAMYVRVIDTKTMQPTDEVLVAPPTYPVKDIVRDIISEEGKQVAKLIVSVMAAHFVFSTVSTILINNTDPKRK